MGQLQRELRVAALALVAAAAGLVAGGCHYEAAVAPLRRWAPSVPAPPGPLNLYDRWRPAANRID